MPQSPDELTRQDLLKGLKAQGYRVTPAQLLRWHDRGLLPQPRREGLGRGRGTTSYYPRIAAAQAGMLMYFLTNDRSLDRAGWNLWALGFPLTAWARDFLIHESREKARNARRSRRTSPARLEKALRSTRLPSNLQRLVKDHGPTLPFMFRMLAGAQLGMLDTDLYADTDWDDFENAFASMVGLGLGDVTHSDGTDYGAEAKASALRHSREFPVVRVIEALTEVPSARLDLYRNECQALWDLLSAHMKAEPGLIDPDTFMGYFKERHMAQVSEADMGKVFAAYGLQPPFHSKWEREVSLRLRGVRSTRTTGSPDKGGAA